MRTPGALGAPVSSRARAPVAPGAETPGAAAPAAESHGAESPGAGHLDHLAATA